VAVGGGVQVNTEAGGNLDSISVERSLLDQIPVLGLDYLAALSRFLDPSAAASGGASLIVDGMEARNASLLSGIPFNITTGRDENGDGLALDRPPGITRNTGRGPGLAVVDLRWYREFRLAPSRGEKSPGATVSMDAFNLFNRVNYQNFAGALSSPFYGRAVATQPARRLQLAFRFQF
jgi:hypothetical protein